MTTRKGKPEQNSRMGQAKRDRKMMACRSGNARTDLPVHDCQYRLPGQDFSVDLPRQYFQNMTSGIEEPEQILLWYNTDFSFHFSTLTKFKRTVARDFFV
jgi:hypothetical protein